jgi:hypothetical protein
MKELAYVNSLWVFPFRYHILAWLQGFLSYGIWRFLSYFGMIVIGLWFLLPLLALPLCSALKKYVPHLTSVLHYLNISNYVLESVVHTIVVSWTRTFGLLHVCQCFILFCTNLLGDIFFDKQMLKDRWEWRWFSFHQFDFGEWNLYIFWNSLWGGMSVISRYI